MQIWSKASQMSRTNEKCNYETNSVVKTQIIVILRAKFLKGFQETNCSGYMLFERVFFFKKPCFTLCFVYKNVKYTFHLLWKLVRCESHFKLILITQV